jgi:hypothetical protein
MEIIINNLETLIDDIERDPHTTKEEILKSLYNIKEQIEEENYQSNNTLEWDDLD